MEAPKEIFVTEDLIESNALDEELDYIDGRSVPYIKYIRADLAKQPEADLLEEAYMRGFAQGAKEERERMKDEHAQDLLYVCQKTAEREHRSGVREGKAQAEKELTPLINRLCEAILFEWKDAADLARKTLTQVKAREEEK